MITLTLGRVSGNTLELGYEVESYVSSLSVDGGNMMDIRRFAEAGITEGSYNLRAIKFWQSQGATSSQYNTAEHQYEDGL